MVAENCEEMRPILPCYALSHYRPRKNLVDSGKRGLCPWDLCTHHLCQANGILMGS